jgi:cytochrome c oxidase assembly protein subunit 11
MADKQNTHRKVIVVSSVMAAVMFIFSFAIVPFYSVICRATGLNTSVPSSELLTIYQAGKDKVNIDKSRSITVQFMTINNKSMPWDFKAPEQTVVHVHPGENFKVYFYAKNTTNKTMTVQAIPSMMPTTAISHFHKIECFCFKQQTLKAHESKNMPLVFQIDKDLPKEVKVISLQYTLFDVTPKEQNRKEAA